MQKHTPTPWRESNNSDGIEGSGSGWIVDATGRAIVDYAGCGSHKAVWAPGAQARAIQCVNACDGIDDPGTALIRAPYDLREALLEMDAGRPAVAREHIERALSLLTPTKD